MVVVSADSTVCSDGSGSSNDVCPKSVRPILEVLANLMLADAGFAGLGAG